MFLAKRLNPWNALLKIFASSGADFVSEAIALERTSDVIPAGFGVGGRGGVTKTGSRVYSTTDSFPDKITKSFLQKKKFLLISF